ncbi:MAG: peptidoglycan-binding protein, partial [Sphingomonadales bacterium]|nr:peptidoglycan-binding protein [Sphingomonadales bacterium]
SYPEALSAPVISFGTLSALSGLAGEADLARLAMKTLPGDAGGPVLDATGAVMGMLLPTQSTAADKLLPEDLALAVQATALAPVLAEKGFAPRAAEATGTRAPEDLARAAQDFTVQIACWE